MNAWIDICGIDDIPRLGSRVIRREQAVDIALFRTSGDRIFALADRCPHKGGPLSQGLVTGERVVCPLHGWTLELASGEATEPDVGCAQAYAVDVHDGRVRLRAGDLQREVMPALAAACDG